jgi:hypothetical protein
VVLEELDQLHEIQQWSREPVELVDHHAVDLPGLDVSQQSPQGRPFERAAREAAVVIPDGEPLPSLVPLAGDIGFARLPLGIEGVELRVEAFVGGFPRVDGATDTPDRSAFRISRASHATRSFPERSPKKDGPFQWVPVMSSAIAVRER